MLHPHHSGDCAAEESDQPAAIDGEAYAMKHAIDCLRTVGQRGHKCQQKMERHAGKRSDAGDVVPFWGFPIGMGEQVHLMGPQVVAQKPDTENDQMLAMQPLLSSAEDGPAVKNQGKVHPDNRL